MKLIIFFVLLFAISCSYIDKSNKDDFLDVDINKELSFNEYKNIIQKKSMSKKFPDINE
tara:strand:+ start:255 stop:431 length:177 start_codon:yes stop_codon:yes gene_type:complete